MTWTISRWSQVRGYLSYGWTWKKGSGDYPHVLETKGLNGGMVLIPGKTKLHCLWRLWKHTKDIRSSVPMRCTCPSDASVPPHRSDCDYA